MFAATLLTSTLFFRLNNASMFPLKITWHLTLDFPPPSLSSLFAVCINFIPLNTHSWKKINQDLTWKEKGKQNNTVVKEWNDDVIGTNPRLGTLPASRWWAFPTQQAAPTLRYLQIHVSLSGTFFTSHLSC